MDDMEGDGPIDWTAVEIDSDGHLVDLSDPRFVTWRPPAPGTPVPVEDLPRVFGRRLILMRDDGPHYDYRAASEVFSDSEGSWIRIISEAAWYRWCELPADSRPASPPHARAWSTRYVFVEVYAG